MGSLDKHASSTTLPRDRLKSFYHVAFFNAIFLSVSNAIYIIKRGGVLVLIFIFCLGFFKQVCVELLSLTFNDHSGSQFQ